MAIETLTSSSLLVLFKGMGDNEKDTFLDSVARLYDDQTLIRMFHAMSSLQQDRFVKKVIHETAKNYLPVLVKEMIKDAQDKGQKFTDEEIERGMQFVDNLMQTKEARLKAELAEARNRKADPENVKRNLEMCSKRRENKKFWTHSRLSKHYSIDASAVRRILKDEAKWKRLAEKTGRTSAPPAQ